MKILLSADPFIPVPPLLYGGIERIIGMLIDQYTDLGHEVTLIAHPESKPACKLVPYRDEQDRVLRNMLLLSRTAVSGKYDVLHSFSRLAYLSPLLPLSLPKIMSYQREPSIGQIRKAMKLASKGSLSFTGCSDYIASQISPYAPAYTVYNGVPVDQYQLTTDLPEDAPLVFLGRIEAIKGTHLAIRIAKKTRRKFIIAGNIPAHETAYFEEQIKPHLDQEQIVYVGAVNDIQKNELLGSAAAFLMPILWNEPFGIVMAEAMACGTPVIGMRRGSVPEVVEHGVTGFVCETEEEMIEAVGMISLISRERVRVAAVERFSAEKIAGDYLRLYEERMFRR